jgi:hypothetical protein
MMQQLARAKFASFGLRVPINWQPPAGTAADQYAAAFKPEERTTQPAVTAGPPLFLPASLNKYHTDAQKMNIASYGEFIDNICAAICSAWAQWQSSATITGLVVAGPSVAVGVLSGPPLEPLIIGQATSKASNAMKYTQVIASAISNGWLAYTATVKCPGLPFYPAYTAVVTPAAPPMPNIPFPLIAFTQSSAPISAGALKAQMIAGLGDPKAPFASQLFEAIATAFEQCYTPWVAATQVTNVFAIATGGTPISPVPAVGTATMAPGGLV